MARTHDKTRLEGIARDARRYRTWKNPNQPQHIWAHNMKLLTAHLIGAWSYATNPNILRTDKEHQYCRKLARAIDKRLARVGIVVGIHFRETDEGDRYCF
jgi:hypothetical protein